MFRLAVKRRHHPAATRVSMVYLLTSHLHMTVALSAWNTCIMQRGSTLSGTVLSLCMFWEALHQEITAAAESCHEHVQVARLDFHSTVTSRGLHSDGLHSGVTRASPSGREGVRRQCWTWPRGRVDEDGVSATGWCAVPCEHGEETDAMAGWGPEAELPGMASWRGFGWPLKF